MEFIFCLLFFVGLFLLVYIWLQFGRFMVLLISNDFVWKDFKSEWKMNDEGFESVIYLCWIIFVPIQLFYFIKEKLFKF